jgi:hypothetical protein
VIRPHFAPLGNSKPPPVLIFLEDTTLLDEKVQQSKLAALGRFHDAQVEARLLVHQYPDTTWAGDVTRHLLTQPLEDPSQRGYGKSSELD